MGYPKQVYQNANAELSRRRQAAANLTAARAAEIERKIPQIAAIRRDLAQTAMSVTKMIVTRPQEADKLLLGLQEKNSALQRQRAALLVKAGYPEDYLSEQVSCIICGGSGFCNIKMCECLRTLLQREALSQLCAVSQVDNCGFSNFRLEYYPNTASGGSAVTAREQMAGVLRECREYAVNFSKHSQSLLMLGQTGLGKTHLSLAIANEVIAAGFGCLYTPAQRLMDRLEASKFSYSPAAKEQYALDMESVLNCDLLVLDDLGSEFITQFSSAMLYNIINARLVEKRPSIISTNLEPSEIEAKYSQRMLSRLIGGYRVFKFSGKDIRIMKKMQG